MEDQDNVSPITRTEQEDEQQQFQVLYESQKQIVESNKFTIQILMTKIQKLQKQYEEEISIMKERGHLQDAKYDINKYDELNANLILDEEHIKNIFLERLEGAKVEFQVKSEGKYNLKKTKKQEEFVDPEIVEQVTVLQHDTDELAKKIKEQMQKARQYDKEKQELQEQIDLLKKRQKQHNINMFSAIKLKMARALQKYQSKSNQLATDNIAKSNRVRSQLSQNVSSLIPQQLSGIGSTVSKLNSVTHPGGDSTRFSNHIPLNTQNLEYQKLHDECNKKISELRKLYTELNNQSKEFQGLLLSLRTRIQRITKKMSIRVQKTGFLEMIELDKQTTEKFLQQIMEDGCLELLLQLCLLDDAVYNIGRQGGRKQRVGLEAESKGLRRRFNVKYDI